jgi:hypothetical protein
MRRPGTRNGHFLSSKNAMIADGREHAPDAIFGILTIYQSPAGARLEQVLTGGRANTLPHLNYYI